MVKWIDKVRKRREEERAQREAIEKEDRRREVERERRRRKEDDMRRDYADRLRKQLQEEKLQKGFKELEEEEQRRQQEEAIRNKGTPIETLPADLQSDLDQLSEDDLFDLSKFDKLKKPDGF